MSKGGSWIQVDGKLIPKDEYHGNNERNQSALIMPDIEQFVSPVDGSIITGRAMLRRHNKAHGVTNMADYSAGYMEKKAVERDAASRGQTQQDKQHRIDNIIRAIDRR